MIGVLVKSEFSATGAVRSGFLRLREIWFRYLLLGTFLTYGAALISFVSLGRFPSESDFPSDAPLLDSSRSLGVVAFSLVGSLFQSLLVLVIYSIAVTVALSNARHAFAGPRGWPGVKAILQVTFGGVGIVLLSLATSAAMFSGGVALASLFSQVLWIGIGAVFGAALWVSVINGTSMFGFLVVDRKASPWSSLWLSWKMVSRYFRSILGLNAYFFVISTLVIAIAVVAALSLSPALLGILLPPSIGFSLGWYTCSMACAYENLKEEGAIP